LVKHFRKTIENNQNTSLIRCSALPASIIH